jgi:hypothetical protein
MHDPSSAVRVLDALETLKRKRSTDVIEVEGWILYYVPRKVQLSAAGDFYAITPDRKKLRTMWQIRASLQAPPPEGVKPFPSVKLRLIHRAGRDPIEMLPPELAHHVLKWSSAVSIVRLGMTCHKAHAYTLSSIPSRIPLLPSAPDGPLFCEALWKIQCLQENVTFRGSKNRGRWLTTWIQTRCVGCGASTDPRYGSVGATWGVCLECIHALFRWNDKEGAIPFGFISRFHTRAPDMGRSCVHSISSKHEEFVRRLFHGNLSA